MIVKRWTNGSWYYVASFRSRIEAEFAVKGLNEYGQWDYKLFEELK